MRLSLFSTCRPVSARGLLTMRDRNSNDDELDAPTSLRDGIALRVVVPHAALPPASPDYFSQRNCELLGLTKRSFLELLRRRGAPPATIVGKLRLVRRDAMLAFLDRLAHEQTELARGRELDGADRVLLELGCAPVRRG